MCQNVFFVNTFLCIVSKHVSIVSVAFLVNPLVIGQMHETWLLMMVCVCFRVFIYVRIHVILNHLTRNIYTSNTAFMCLLFLGCQPDYIDVVKHGQVLQPPCCRCHVQQKLMNALVICFKLASRRLKRMWFELEKKNIMAHNIADDITRSSQIV